FAGASPGSSFDDGLSDLGSFFTTQLNDLLTPHPFDNFFAFSVTPDVDLVTLTGNFQKSGSSSFTNGLYVPSNVPNPSTYVLLITGLLGLLGYSWWRQRAG